MSGRVRRAPRSFAARVIGWQREHGRHDLPWQGTRDPYRIWLAEVMLQQTQVTTVIPYYQRFLARFPDLSSLARASGDEVLRLWSGLGYYTRGRNLHRAARLVVTEHGGVFPATPAAIARLPGVGRSTAAAIAVFAFGARAAILDGNVKRVLARVLALPGTLKQHEGALWRHAESLLPAREIERYTQGMMDLGAGVCVRAQPRCRECPLQTICRAHRDGQADTIPGGAARKTLPHRRARMLLVLHQGEVLLEKRPPTGVWASLWSFPLLEMDIDSAAYCDSRFGLRVRCLPAWETVEHGFTHFRLTITPQPVLVTGRAARVEQHGVLWLSAADALQAAIPKPVKDLLRRLEAAPPK